MQKTQDLKEKLLRLQHLELEIKDLRQELKVWLEESRKEYLTAWLENQIENKKEFSLLELKSNLSDLRYHSSMNDNVFLWHQINEVQKMIDVYERFTQ